jgi:hypothetical protein
MLTTFANLNERDYARSAPPGPERAPARDPEPSSVIGPTRTRSLDSGFGYAVDNPTGDKKKSDDNGGAGVPADPKQFNPTTPNTDTSGMAVPWSTVEKPQDPTWDNGFDEKAAKRLGGGRHSSLAELGTNLELPLSMMRYRRLIIAGHGNASMLATGSGDGPDTSDALNLKESNKATWLPFFSRDKFYGRAEIWLMSCNVGNGPIPQLIADQSGSTVYAYTRTAFANEKAPWD